MKARANARCCDSTRTELKNHIMLECCGLYLIATLAKTIQKNIKTPLRSLDMTD